MSERIDIPAGTWTRITPEIELYARAPWTVVVADGVVDLWGDLAGGAVLVRAAAVPACPDHASTPESGAASILTGARGIVDGGQP